jgi:predicted small metal-binding protein
VGEEELSTTVREHFCEEHGMERPRGIDSTSPMTYGQAAPVGGLKTGRQATVAGENIGEPVEQMGTAWKEATTERVQCPTCMEMLEGCDCEELSTRLEEHMTESHGKESFMQGTKEKVKGR